MKNCPMSLPVAVINWLNALAQEVITLRNNSSEEEGRARVKGLFIFPKRKFLVRLTFSGDEKVLSSISYSSLIHQSALLPFFAYLPPPFFPFLISIPFIIFSPFSLLNNLHLFEAEGYHDDDESFLIPLATPTDEVTPFIRTYYSDSPITNRL